MDDPVRFSSHEMDRAMMFRELGVTREPGAGDWVMTPVDRDVSLVVSATGDGRILTTADLTAPRPVEHFVWLPLENQLRQILVEAGLKFLTVEAGDDYAKCYGWYRLEDWKAAEPENLWARGQSVRETLMWMVVKLLPGGREIADGSV